MIGNADFARQPRYTWGVAPLLLALAGLGLMLAITDGDAWSLALIWIGAVCLFALVWRSLERGWLRVTVAVAAALVLMVLTFEGGLFLLPALVAAAATPASSAGRGAR
jgi:hypothetical protein